MGSAALNNTGGGILLASIPATYLYAAHYGIPIPWWLHVIIAISWVLAIVTWVGLDSDIQKKSNDLAYKEATSTIGKLDEERRKLRLEGDLLVEEINKARRR